MPRQDLSWTSEYEEFVESIMEEHDIPGVSVAVADESEVLYARGFGYRNLEDKLPATADTLYGMASVTKSFTALATVMLEEEGAASTGNPVIDHLEEFRYAGDARDRAITLHHFLTHTSGIPPTGALRYSMIRSIEGDPSVEEIKKAGRWEDFTDREPIDTYEDLLAYLDEDDQDLLGRPGSKFSYSNDAYSLLGTIVQRESGMSFEDYATLNILKPLRMDASTFDLDEVEAATDVTQLYAKNRDEEVYAAPKWQDAPAMVGAGFLRSTVNDMARYGQLYLKEGQWESGQIVSAKSLRRMWGPYFPSTRSQYYGYGLMVRPDYHGVTLVEHGGSLKGVSSNFGFVPEKGVTVTVVANLQGVPASKMWLGAVNLMLGIDVNEKRSIEPEYEARCDELERFTGSYRSGEGARVEVFVDDDGQLVARMEGKNHSLRPSGPNTAAIMRRGEEAMVCFIPGPSGEVEAMYNGLRIIRKVSDCPDI